MTLEELDRLFEDPARRPLGCFYRCAADPRIIAPSRPGVRGWQINFAHPRAVPFLLFYLGALVVPLALAALFGPRNFLSLAFLAGVSFSMSVVFLIGVSRHLSRQHAN